MSKIINIVNMTGYCLILKSFILQCLELISHMNPADSSSLRFSKPNSIFDLGDPHDTWLPTHPLRTLHSTQPNVESEKRESHPPVETHPNVKIKQTT